MKSNHKRWLSLLVITAMAVLLVACTGSSQSSEESNGNETTINVLAEDFSFSLDLAQTEAGRIIFLVKNNGSMHHDFAIRGNGVEQKTPAIEPGESATLGVDLEPGTYTYVCTIPGHEQLGMVGTFTVISN